MRIVSKLIKYIVSMSDKYDNSFGNVNEEPLVYSPYNPNNKEVTSEDIKGIFQKYDLPIDKIHNLVLYKRAFVHRSYVKKSKHENKLNNIVIEECPEDCIPLKTKSNERLEFLGDGILECVTKYYLYRRFPKEDEGFMTQKKINIVKNEHIGKLAYDIGLHRFFIISKHAEEKHIRNNVKKLGCLFEAFIAAMFLDFNKTVIEDEDKWFSYVFVTGPGFQMVQKFIENVFEKHVDWTSLLCDDDNYKNILQIRIQKHFKAIPSYLMIENEEDIFHMGVYLVLNYNKPLRVEDAILLENMTNLNMDEHPSMFVLLGTGKHKIKKKAEQMACNVALKSLNEKKLNE